MPPTESAGRFRQAADLSMAFLAVSSDQGANEALVLQCV
jgi:hypothetical protein